MSIKVTITEEEILVRPNYYELGEFTQQKYWQAKRDQEGPKFDDEHFGISIGENGLVTSINRHGDYDICVICGKESPYTKSTHIDVREGYVEGSGQGCFQPNICKK
jgi:hypothetical protein